MADDTKRWRRMPSLQSVLGGTQDASRYFRVGTWQKDAVAGPSDTPDGDLGETGEVLAKRDATTLSGNQPPEKDIEGVLLGMALAKVIRSAGTNDEERTKFAHAVREDLEDDEALTEEPEPGHAYVPEELRCFEGPTELGDATLTTEVPTTTAGAAQWLTALCLANHVLQHKTEGFHVRKR